MIITHNFTLMSPDTTASVDILFLSTLDKQTKDKYETDSSYEQSGISQTQSNSMETFLKFNKKRSAKTDP